jgi:peptide/nickel transport system substrate-binding protein
MKTGDYMKQRLFSIIALLLISLSLSLSLSAFQQVDAQQIPRNQMIVVGGSWWEPPKKWNPFNHGGAASGTVGLIYEPLYIWIPIKPENQRFIPWLAKDMPTWESPKSVVIKLRDEAKWWDGRPVTADDIIFTYYDVPHSLSWCAWCGVRDYISAVEKIDDKTIRFRFTDNPNYANFLYNLYTTPILPRHALKSFVDQYKDELVDLSKWPIVAPDKDPKKIVASGMYKINTLADDYFILERVDDWWGRNIFGLPAPKYVKGVVVYSNQVAANMLGAGELDWSNFYIPGGPDMVRKGLVIAFYKKYPYYLSANVAFLFVNTQKPPFNDPRFRKAMYYAIDVDKIISAAFEGVVIKSNPVGLLPYWDRYLATDLIQKYNYSYNPDMAKKILDEAGYKVGPDGCRVLPDGKPIKFTIIVPYGWTDWMFAIINIADDLRKVGICAETAFPDFGLYVSMIDKGDYDAAINNFGSSASPHPYTLYYWAYRASPGIWTGNHGRYNNTQLNALIDKLATIPPLPEYDDQMKQVLRDIQKILLEEMPALPLWYNGYWFLASTKYWINWPTEDNPYAVPVSWNGMWQHGGLLTLLNLKPAVQQVTTPIAPATTLTIPMATATTVIVTTPKLETVTVSGPAVTIVSPTQPAQPTDYTALIIGGIIVVIVVFIAALLLVRRGKK